MICGLFVRLQAGNNVEMTWVISDFVGSAGTNELSVTKGQQVEVLEMSATTADYCLVRVAAGSTSAVTTSTSAGSSSKSSGSSSSGAAGGASGSQPQEGLVPMSILKPPPTFSSKTSPRRTLDLENSGKCHGVLSCRVSGGGYKEIRATKN